MPKATRGQLQDKGFTDEMFGSPADWDQDDGYLDRILADAELAVRDKIGDTAYDNAAAASVTEMRIERAELAWSASELWRRRAAFADSNASASLETGDYLRQREYFKHAERLLDEFHDKVGAITGNWPGSAISVGHTEVGPFEAHSSNRLN